MTRFFDEFKALMDEARIPYKVRHIEVKHKPYKDMLTYVSTLKRRFPVWFEVADWFVDKGKTQDEHLLLWGVCAKAGLKSGTNLRCIPASEVADYAAKDWRGFMQDHRGYGLFMDGITEDEISEKEWIALAKVHRVWRSEQWPTWYTSVFEIKHFVGQIMPNEPEALERFGKYLVESAQVIKAEDYVHRTISSR